MMLDALVDLSWFAVAVATLAYYVLGALWFTPLFGRAWDESIGRTRSKGDRFPASSYLVPLVSSLMVTVTMAALLSAAPPATRADALGLGLVVGLGVAVAVSVTNALTPHTPHPFRLGFITGGYHLVGIVLATWVLAAMSD